MIGSETRDASLISITRLSGCGMPSTMTVEPKALSKLTTSSGCSPGTQTASQRTHGTSFTKPGTGSTTRSDAEVKLDPHRHPPRCGHRGLHRVAARRESRWHMDPCACDRCECRDSASRAL